jgi:hypothetical protein
MTFITDPPADLEFSGIREHESTACDARLNSLSNGTCRFRQSGPNAVKSFSMALLQESLAALAADR